MNNQQITFSHEEGSPADEAAGQRFDHMNNSSQEDLIRVDQSNVCQKNLAQSFKSEEQMQLAPNLGSLNNIETMSNFIGVSSFDHPPAIHKNYSGLINSTANKTFSENLDLATVPQEMSTTTDNPRTPLLGNTKINLIYDPETQVFYRENNDGSLTLTELQLSQFAEAAPLGNPGHSSSIQLIT